MGFGAGQAMKLEERATAEILDKAQVVATTCVGAGDPRLAGRTFRICAIDEATQAPTPPPSPVLRPRSPSGPQLSHFQRCQLLLLEVASARWMQGQGLPEWPSR